jgi:hypothetical protein
MHFTSVYLTSDVNGAFTGSVTVDAYQTISDDGQTWVSNDGTVTIRDASNNVTFVVPKGGPEATGIRINVGSYDFIKPIPGASSAP